MKKIFSFAVVLVLAFCMTVTTFATDSNNMGMGIATETVQPQQNSNHSSNSLNDMYKPVRPGDVLDLEPVTTDDLKNKIDEKGRDIIDVIINVCQKICVVAMPIGAIMFLIGLAGNKKTSVGGAIMFIFSGVCYAAITCAPELIWYISSWIAS